MPTAKSTDHTSAFERQAAHAKALGQAFGNPIRYRILHALSRREASPAELAEEFDLDLQEVAYHFRYLATVPEPPMIELVDTDRRRGGTQHFYRRVDRHRVNMEVSETLPRSAREDISAAIVERMMADLHGALQAGTIDDHPQRSLMQVDGVVDDLGMNQLAELVERYVSDVEETIAESQMRIADSGKAGIPIVSETVVIPVPAERGLL